MSPEIKSDYEIMCRLSGINDSMCQINGMELESGIDRNDKDGIDKNGMYKYSVDGNKKLTYGIDSNEKYNYRFESNVNNEKYDKYRFNSNNKYAIDSNVNKDGIKSNGMLLKTDHENNDKYKITDKNNDKKSNTNKLLPISNKNNEILPNFNIEKKSNKKRNYYKI
ncbi:hypothetical protein NAPIS_ORF01205 [Vairimorpha apis BRL 01]|uniref:Uncharacterized protein n=1 Tax=Vairimorpha apis BRL 01 TaxID=1037528 RepID=T0L9P6_9MICR|nr:hypothetical protein NAPIS_ORF01205 [Vairimorpha apis BRL 01]